MDYEVLYSTRADTVEGSDVIRIQGDDEVGTFHVDAVEDQGEAIAIFGYSDDSDATDVILDPDQIVDILGN